MELSTAKKILKFAGILSIIEGVFVLLLGILAVAGSGYAAQNMPEMQTNPDYQTAAGVMIVGSIALIIGGIFTIVQGGFSVAASKNGKHAMTALVFSIITLLSGIYNGVKGFTSAGGATSSTVISLVLSIVISMLICFAANTVRVAYKEGRDQ